MKVNECEALRESMMDESGIFPLWSRVYWRQKRPCLLDKEAERWSAKESDNNNKVVSKNEHIVWWIQYIKLRIFRTRRSDQTAHRFFVAVPAAAHLFLCVPSKWSWQTKSQQWLWTLNMCAYAFFHSSLEVFFLSVSSCALYLFLTLSFWSFDFFLRATICGPHWFRSAEHKRTVC